MKLEGGHVEAKLTILRRRMFCLSGGRIGESYLCHLRLTSTPHFFGCTSFLSKLSSETCHRVDVV